MLQHHIFSIVAAVKKKPPAARVLVQTILLRRHVLSCSSPQRLLINLVPQGCGSASTGAGDKSDRFSLSHVFTFNVLLT